MLKASALKSKPPISTPIAGMTMSPTSDDTILPNAVPMMTPTARSTTLPFIAKSRNSRSTLMPSLPGLQVFDFENFEALVARRGAHRHGIALAYLEQRLRYGREPRYLALP